MPHCAVISCSNQTKFVNKRNSGVSYHRFPNDPYIKDKWILATGKYNWFPQKHDTICSDHFEARSYTKRSKRAYLSSDAIPTLKLHRLLSKINSFTNTNEIQYPPNKPPEKRRKNPQQKPLSRGLSPIGESGDADDDDDSIYERDVSPIASDGDDEATVPAGSSRRHEGYRCDVCRGDIVGFRYACLQCANFDLCAACEARGQHATHYVLRIPHTKLNLDARAVLKKIRDQLLLQDTESSIKIEVKEESELEPDPLEKTCDDEPTQHHAASDVEHEESEDSLAVKYLSLNEEANQPIFKVESHQPIEQSHEIKVQSYYHEAHSHQAKAQSHKPEVHSHNPKEQSQVTKVQSYYHEVHSHQAKAQSHKPEVHSHKPKEQSQETRVQSYYHEVHSHQAKAQSHKPEVHSHKPKAQSHQTQVQSHRAKVQSQDPSLIRQKKRPLTYEGSDTDTEGAGGEGGEGEYAVYTHRADGDGLPAESSSASEEFLPTDTKRKR